MSGPYLIVITKKAKVGEINGQAVWKITGTEMISYKKTTFHLNEQQVSVVTLLMFALYLYIVC